MKKILCRSKAKYVLALISLLLLTASGFVKADTLEQQKSQQESKLREIRRQIEIQRAKITQTRAEKNTLQASLSMLDSQMQKTALELEEVQTLLDGTTLEIARIEKALREKEDELTDQQQLLKLVVRTIYMSGDFSLIEALATSDTISQSMAKFEYLSIIRERKESLIGEIEAIRSTLAVNKQEQEVQKAEAERLKADIEAKNAQLVLERETKDSLLAETKGEEVAYQEALQLTEEQQKKLAGEVTRINNEIARQAELARQNSNGASSNLGNTGSFSLPLSGPITQKFNEMYPEYVFQLYPYLRNVNGGKHTGIDFGIPQGTAVKASADAIVSLTQSNKYGYGNLIILDHGKGVITLYGHLSAIGVTTGQKVKRGEVIGKSGNTGTSSGAHLHWECRANGKLVNPMTYSF